MKLEHECPEWDFLQIDEGSWEMYINCPCYDFETRKAAALEQGISYDKWEKEEREWNERMEEICNE